MFLFYSDEHFKERDAKFSFETEILITFLRAEYKVEQRDAILTVPPAISVDICVIP